MSTTRSALHLTVMALLAALAMLGLAGAALAQSGMPAIAEMPGEPTPDPDGYLAAFPRVDPSGFRRAFPNMAIVVPDPQVVTAFCTEAERIAYAAVYITPNLEATRRFRNAIRTYGRAMAARLTALQAELAANPAAALKAEEAVLVAELRWTREWREFANRVGRTLADAEDRVLRASQLIQCRKCEIALETTPPYLGKDNARHLTGKRFRFTSREPDDPKRLVVEITVTPGIGCRERTIGYSVFAGGEANQANYFRYNVITGVMPPYPDIFPEQLLDSVVTTFDIGAPVTDKATTFEATAPAGAKSVRRIEFRFRSGQRDASGQPILTSVFWP